MTSQRLIGIAEELAEIAVYLPTDDPLYDVAALHIDDARRALQAAAAAVGQAERRRAGP